MSCEICHPKARRAVAPMVDKIRESEDIGELPNMVLKEGR